MRRTSEDRRRLASAHRRRGEKRRCRHRVRTSWGVVDSDPRGAAVHRVLHGAEALQDFPALLQFARPLLFAEGISRILLCAEALQDFPAFEQFAPPLRYLLIIEVKQRVAGDRGVRRGWGGRTNASLRAGCGSRSGSATPLHSNLYG